MKWKITFKGKDANNHDIVVSDIIEGENLNNMYDVISFIKSTEYDVFMDEIGYKFELELIK